MDDMTLRAKIPLYLKLSFGALCDHYGLLDGQLLTLLEVDKRTLANWRKKDNAPVMARKLISLHYRGLLGADWGGFYVEGDTLVTPIGQRLSTGEIMGWFYKQQLLKSLQYSNRALKQSTQELQSKISSANSIFRIDGTLKESSLK